MNASSFGTFLNDRLRLGDRLTQVTAGSGSTVYRIRPNFRGAQFSQIAISKHFVETIFADQEFQVLYSKISRA